MENLGKSAKSASESMKTLARALRPIETSMFLEGQKRDALLEQQKVNAVVKIGDNKLHLN